MQVFGKHDQDPVDRKLLTIALQFGGVHAGADVDPSSRGPWETPALVEFVVASPRSAPVALPRTASAVTAPSAQAAKIPSNHSNRHAVL